MKTEIYRGFGSQYLALIGKGSELNNGILAPSCTGVLLRRLVDHHEKQRLYLARRCDWIGTRNDAPLEMFGHRPDRRHRQRAAGAVAQSALAQDRPGEGTHGSTMARGNDDAVGADQEALPRGASAQGRSAVRNMNMKNIPLVISDPFLTLFRPFFFSVGLGQKK
jgi:hypothetical protein